MSSRNLNISGKDNLFNILINKYLPFWPLFLGLLILGLLTAWIYLGFTTPKYETSAALIVKDEKKGVDDANIMESINVFNSKKIVENEIEVLHSRDIVHEVVDKLHLYAPISYDNFVGAKNAYGKSPIHVVLKDPFDITNYLHNKAVKFSYDDINGKVQIGEKKLPIGEWLPNPTGGSDIKFVLNEHWEENDIASNDYSYSLINPKSLVENMIDNLYVGASSKLSSVVRLSYVDSNPKRGEDVISQLIDSYIDATLQDRDTLAANTVAFVETRMEEVGIQLQEVEKELEKYRSSEGVVDLSEQGSLYLTNVGEYDRRIADINLQLSVLDKVDSYVVSKSTNSGIVPSTLGIGDPILSELLQRLYDAEIQYEQLRKTTAENNPILVSIRNEIAKIRPSILENVRSQRTNLRASLGNLYANSSKYSDALKVLPEQERKLVEISRRKKSITELYDYLVQKREETALSYAPSPTDVRVIEKAQSSLDPVSPKKPIVYLTSLLTFLTIGVFWVSGRELFSSKVLFRSEVEENTETPVFGELAYLNKEKGELRIDKHQDVFIIDQFRQALTYLGAYRRSNPIRKVMVTSSIAGEGKSYVSANLALTLSSSGKKIALLDMDMRNSNITSMFGLQNELGISEYLNGKIDYHEIVNGTSKTQLSVFPSGQKALNSSELLAGKYLNKFFDLLQNDFDHIIIDTPPISLVSDATLLTEFCDRTLLIVRHAYTPKFIVKHIDENIKLKGLKNCAILFNGVKHRGLIKQEYGYGYGYGYEATPKEENGHVIPELVKNVLGKLRKQLAR